MSIEEAEAYAATPQAEGRIGHEDRVKDIYREMIKDNRDRLPGEGLTYSVFLEREQEN